MVLHSTENSTTTPLAAAGTYTGEWELNELPEVGVSCKTDGDGTLYFDFSNDGVNVDTFPTAGFAVASGIHEFHTGVKLPRYFRVRLVNGSTEQTYLRLYTYYGANFRQPSAPSNQAVGLDADAIFVRTSLPWWDISRGLLTGMSVDKKFGHNTAVGTTYVPITESGIYRTPQAAAATTLRIKAGGDANDTAAGTGAREITLEGLDENFAYATEAVATAGASASAVTTTTFTRLYRAFVSSSGTYATQSAGSHAAAITIENGTGGTDWAKIPANGFPHSQSEIGAYSVATGYTAYVFLEDVVVDTSKSTDLLFFHRGGIDETASPYSAMRVQASLPGISNEFLNLTGAAVPLGPFAGPCDLGYMAKVDVGTASVSCSFEIYLVQE